MAQAEEKKQDAPVADDAVNNLRENLLKVLTSQKISDLEIKSNVIVLDSKIDPKQAIEVLLQNNIRAAPVMDADTKKFIGVLDLRDTVKFALETYKDQSSKLHETKEKAMKYLTAAPTITTQSLKYLAQMRKFKTVKTSDSLLVVAEVLAAGSHIVGVVDESKNTLSGIITQGSFFQQVAKKWSDDKNTWKDCKVSLSQIEKLKYISSPVKSVKSNTKAYDAFELMSKLDLSGLAVVDENGKLVHNTSATDIKLWLLASSTLELGIQEFLNDVRKLSLLEKYPVTYCTSDETLERAVAKLRATKYHRMWIVNAKTEPEGVLALTDIFKFLCKTKEQQQ